MGAQRQADLSDQFDRLEKLVRAGAETADPVDELQIEVLLGIRMDLMRLTAEVRELRGQ